MKQEGDTSAVPMIPPHLQPALDREILSPAEFLNLAMGLPSTENPIVQNKECSRARAASVTPAPFREGGAA